MKHSLSKKGKSPTEAEEEAIKKVLSMLPHDGSRIRWSELEEKARSEGMSLRTLSKHLDGLTKAKLVARDVDAEARPPRVYFQLMTSGIFEGVFKWMPQEAVDPRALGAKITKIKDPEIREQALGGLLEWLISLLVLEMLRTWQFGIMFSENEQAKSFYRIMISSYMAPMIVDLGSLCKAHSDIAQDTLTNLFSRYAENSHKAGSEVERIDPTFFETKRKGTT